MGTPISSLDQLTAALADHYAIDREIGAGGMATVYLARDLRLERPVAIKVLAAAHSAALGADRFDREIKLLARLRHPFVLPLHDSGSANGALYFVMPYIDGESLRTCLVRQGKLSLAATIPIVRQVAEALDYAHTEGVVHRDVKPENILLSRHGHALLADFGIARLRADAPRSTEAITAIGMAVGTAAYMSPEQALATAVDGRSDIYALGCVVFEMLTGQAPFHGSTAFSLVAQHIGMKAPSLAEACPGLPDCAVQAVARALEKDPAERFPTAMQFACALVTTDIERSVPTQTVLTPRLSIAVLPVVNRSTDAEAEFFSEGMTEELINALAKVEGLRVMSRTSTMPFAGGGKSVEEIGAQLHIGFILEGSVRRAGHRLRMTARLIQTSDGSTLWSEMYERQLEDVFAVQDDITLRIVETITQTLQLGGLRGDPRAKPPRSLEAYDLYLLGRHHWYRRTESAMRRALELFEQALALDPEYAPAHSGIADACAILASWQFASPAEMYPRAAAAARRALSLDPSSADAHASLGFVKINWEWDWDGAASELRTAITLNPNHETAHRWLSSFLAGIGRFDEAIPVARRCMQLDPISVLPHMNLGIIMYLAGRHEEASAEFARVVEKDPSFQRGHAFLAATHAFSGRLDEAASEARATLALSPERATTLAWVAAVLGVAGHIDEARATISRARAARVQPMFEAIAHAAVGDPDAMLAALERGFEERSDWMYTIGTQPWFRPYHAHPQFTHLIERMHL